MLFSSILPMKGQFIMKGMQLLKTSPQLIEAILALMNQYRACVLCMKLLVVAYFYVHHQQKKSMIKFVLDSFLLVQLSELLNTFLQCTVFCCSSSSVRFWLCLIGLSMVHPWLNYKFTRMFKPRTSGCPSGLGILRNAST